ncbi:hypothetical protein ANN_22687 [Periplaneta americana]|uniref:Uncharacterized protein n=1 Tax=Periplaneta americana TaxID=6978 RepID=A0ABQ8S9A4_PERAM|nr:hypothetical protein ANN_22687 [Periplaneta americana]
MKETPVNKERGCSSINGTSTSDGPVKRNLQGRRKTTVPSLMLAGNEFQSLGRAIVKEDEYEEVRWDGIVSIVSWRERVFRLWWEERVQVRATRPEVLGLKCSELTLEVLGSKCSELDSPTYRLPSLFLVFSTLLWENAAIISIIQRSSSRPCIRINPSDILVVVITEDVQNVHLLLEYTPHIDVSLTCEHDPKLQEYCVCPQNMPQFDSEGIANQAQETNKPMIINGPTNRNREGSDQGNLNSNRYIREVLEPEVLPLLQATPHAFFQQDNDQQHVARIVQAFFED